MNETYAIKTGHKNLYVAMKKKSIMHKKQMLIQAQTAIICRRLSTGIPLIGAQRTCCDREGCGFGWFLGALTFVSGVSDAVIVSDDDEFMLQCENEWNIE